MQIHTVWFVRISIHAPRVGSDRNPMWYQGGDNNFNPRSPCGERLTSCAFGILYRLFQSTLPVWGATAKLHKYFLKFYRI